MEQPTRSVSAGKTEIITISGQGYDNLGLTIGEPNHRSGTRSSPNRLTDTTEFETIDIRRTSNDFGKLNSIELSSSTDTDIKMRPFASTLRSKWKTLGTEFFILLLVTIVVILIELGVIPQIKQGFFCDDRKIQFIYDGDTISNALIISSITFPLIIIWIAEFIAEPSTLPMNSRVRSSLLNMGRWSQYYLIGIISHFFILDLIKILVGEPRPHFLQSCMPHTFNVNCSETERAFVSEYKCTNEHISRYDLLDSTRSFPSGHSSIGFFEAIFTIWYLHTKFPRQSKILMTFLKTICLSWAFLCALSRISDNRHHWWDVLGGSILGIVFASLTCSLLCKNFRIRRVHQNGIKMSPTQNGTSERDKQMSVKRLISVKSDVIASENEIR